MTLDDVNRNIDDLNLAINNLTNELKDINSNLSDIAATVSHGTIEHTFDYSAHSLIDRLVSRLEQL